MDLRPLVQTQHLDRLDDAFLNFGKVDFEVFSQHLESDPSCLREDRKTRRE